MVFIGPSTIGCLVFLLVTLQMPTFHFWSEQITGELRAESRDEGDSLYD